jgi:L-ribulose-5-phosphate 4-epimerase
VILARALWREGYNDHLAGHITCNLGDGTLLCNPWLLTWDELVPRALAYRPRRPCGGG